MTDLLTTLADKHGTDKGLKSFANQFAAIYDKYLNPTREQVTAILEIGIAQGGSLRMWREYFPNATIYGIDCNPGFLFQESRIKTFLGDQSNRNQLRILVENLPRFDMIIDDGSHNTIHQQITFGCLFPFLKQSGYYIIEDLHTSFGWGNLDWGLPANHPHTAYNALKAFKDSGYRVLSTPYITESEKSNIIGKVEFIELFDTYSKPGERVTSIIKKIGG